MKLYNYEEACQLMMFKNKRMARLFWKSPDYLGEKREYYKDVDFYPEDFYATDWYIHSIGSFHTSDSEYIK